MPKPTWNSHQITFKEVLERRDAVEAEFGVRIRFTVISGVANRGKGSSVIMCTPYHSNGRKMADVTAEQHMWPTAAYKSREALEMYLLVRLEQALSDYEQHLANVSLADRAAGPTALEQYISRSFEA